MKGTDDLKMIASHLGGGIMQARLREKGWTDAQIGAECKRMIDEEWDALNRFCGGALGDIENPAWKLSMTYHTAMRILNEREGVAGKPLADTREIQRIVESEDKEPIRSWYDTDDIDDYDDLGADFG